MRYCVNFLAQLIHELGMLSKIHEKTSVLIITPHPVLTLVHNIEEFEVLIQRISSFYCHPVIRIRLLLLLGTLSILWTPNNHCRSPETQKLFWSNKAGSKSKFYRQSAEPSSSQRTKLKSKQMVRKKYRLHTTEMLQNY